MICPRCNVEMVDGIAIKPNTEKGAIYICAPGPIKAKDVKLISVLKCPLCGYSDDGK